MQILSKAGDIMVLLNAFGSIFSIGIMIILGYVLAHKNWFDENSSNLLAKLVTTISLPVMMVYSLMTTFNKDKLLSLRSGLIIPFLSIGICWLLGILFSKVLYVNEKRKGVFQSMFFISNTIFVGLPVNLALFGDESVPYVLLYYIANTTFFWTIGAQAISKDGNGNLDSNLVDTLKRIFSPPLLGFIVAIILILLNVTLPKFVMDTFKYLGNLTTPLSMIFIGITIHSVKPTEIHFDKDMFGVLLGRFIISPLSVVILAHFIKIPPLMRNVFIMQAAMPVMTQTAIISKAYGADHKFAAVLIAVTTALSLIFIPLYMVLL